MKPARRLTLCALLCTVPAMALAGGAIRSGEHDGFSRLVLNIETARDWTIEQTDTGISVFFPEASVRYDTRRVFDLIPQTRIGAVSSEIGEDGTRVNVDLTCDCRVSTLNVGSRFIALDISDPGAELLEESVVHYDTGALSEEEEKAEQERNVREAVIVSGAERTLIEQIQRAADQGLIRLDETEGSGPEALKQPESLNTAYSRLSSAMPPAQPKAPSSGTPPELPLASQEAKPPSAGALALLFDDAQIQASTVFDRYSARHAERLAERATPLECIPDHRLDIAYWSDGTELFDQAPDLHKQLVGEFDTPNTEAVLALAQLYIRFGLGAEAIAILDAFGIEGTDHALLSDLARIVDGKPVAPYGPLTRSSACPGRHGLWLAIGGSAPAFHNDQHFGTVTAAFSEMPPDLRLLIGPRLVENLLLTQHVEPARAIYDIIIRSGVGFNDELRSVEAVLVAREGNPAIAIQSLSALLEKSGANPVSVLGNMVNIAIDSGYPVPERTVTDLRAAILQHRGTPEEAELRRLLALALSERNELAEAVKEVRIARESGVSDEVLEDMTLRILKSANPETDGAAVYADVMLEIDDLISEAPKNDEVRLQVAEHLLELGLPRPAEQVVIPAAGRSRPGRIMLAKAFLAQGQYSRARQILSGDAGAEVSEIVAKSYEAEGILPEDDDATGLSDNTSGVPAGPTLATREDGQTAAALETATPAPAPPSPFTAPGLPGGQATNGEPDLTDPLPRLEEPSLASTRELLATGEDIQEFVEGLLKNP